LIYLLIGQMVLAPAFSDSIFQDLRSEKKNPRRASPLRGSIIPGGRCEEIKGLRPASISNRAKSTARATQLSSEGS
jgi:hypothetical protein